MGEKKLADLVKSEDFKQVRHIVFMKNETSQTHFSESDNITILEMGTNYLILEGPANCCQNGHQISLSLMPFKRNNPEQKKAPTIHAHKNLLSVVAKVDEYAALEHVKGRATWRVNLTQFNQDDWQHLLNLYEAHQQAINSLVSEKDS